MKKRIIHCSTTSTQEILRAARTYFLSEGFEVQEVLTESGEIGLQARKTGWLRKCSGTSYALQVVVKELPNNRFEVTAGWGEWVSKGAVALFATFVACGFLILPAIYGFINQMTLPDECLDSITATVSHQNPLCRIYEPAKA